MSVPAGRIYFCVQCVGKVVFGRCGLTIEPCVRLGQTKTGTHRADQRQTGVVRQFIRQPKFGTLRQSAQAEVQKHKAKG